MKCDTDNEIRRNVFKRPCISRQSTVAAQPHHRRHDSQAGWAQPHQVEPTRNLAKQSVPRGAGAVSSGTTVAAPIDI